MANPKKTKKNEPVRLNKFIADSGVASRRKADELIREGSVTVNGRTVQELGSKIIPGEDSVKVKNKIIRTDLEKIYYMFHKPAGILTTMDTEEERPTVAEYFKKLKHRVFPVGRLDWDTEGLLLVTNDGDFAQEVIHPSKKIPKTYLVKLNGTPSPQKLNKLLTGVTIPGGRVKALHVESIKRGTSDKYSWAKIVIVEGKNRQIRYMFNKIGFDVKKLQRTAIGQLTLGSLKRGEFTELKASQLIKLFKITEENFNPVQPSQDNKRSTPATKKNSSHKDKKPYAKKALNKKKTKSKKASKSDYFKQLNRESKNK